MNEEIEYAEMLEIPLSTVNVVRKNQRKKRKASTDMQDVLIERVNDKVSQSPTERITADADAFAESANSAGEVRFEDIPERIDTIRLYGENDRPYLEDTPQVLFGEDAGDIPPFARSGKEGKLRKILGAEFAVACALCCGIFLTNVFVQGSAINTFFRSISGNAAATNADTRSYAEFTLSGVVNDYTDVEINLSDTGVLTFQQACHVYPVADGTVREVVWTDGGSYTLKIGYSDSFTGVVEGLDQVYYQVGEEVKSNVPVGYTAGERQVQVTMYSDGELLNCFQITEENCLAWLAQE